MAVPDIAVGDIVQVTLRTEWETQQYLNVLHYRCINPPTDPTYLASLTNLAAYLETSVPGSIVAPLRPLIGDDVSVKDITVQRVYPSRDFYYRDGINLNGSATASTTAGNISAVITKRSERAGRGRPGSFHIAGVPEGQYGSGVLVPDYLTGMEALALALRTPAVNLSGSLSVWKPGMFNAALGAPNNWSDIIGTLVQDTVRVIRRRTLRLGI